MTEIIKTKNNSCTGCNRCVRECPMETANITYKDEEGNIKVKIDYDKCIVCGRCITACKHDARFFADDTERFFDDLSKGIPISLIAAPSIRTNIPNYKNLFTFLKNLGVKLIYDVSFGADICVWAHIRYIRENGITPIITQPCPVTVSYCEKYRHDLLSRLSPVHSPMACISVYMKKYKGIKDSIAAISPCIAKAQEFEDTKLSQYNITFTSLLEYLKIKNISLPDIETQFDSDESGLGSIFPMPGGLKANIEFFMGKSFHITKAGGFSVYEKLNQYAETTPEFLPDIFDVLNCEEGCNLGSAYSNDRSIFEIDKIMNNKIKNTVGKQKHEHYQSLFNIYNDTLALSDFIREYKTANVSIHHLTDEDINRAFMLLGKDNYYKQNIDCGACGSATCKCMARKIALNVNIPSNCIVKSMEDAKTEHEKNVVTHEQLTKMKKTLEADELVRIMIDVNPHINILFDDKFNFIDCNPAATSFMGFKTKEETLINFFEQVEKGIPEFQPSGRKSETLAGKLSIAKTEGAVRFKTIIIINGSQKSLDVEFKKIPYKNSFAIVGFIYDMTSVREHEMKLVDAQEKNELQLTKLNAVVNATRIGLWEVAIVNNDPMNIGNIFSWSDEFRYMLGYTSVKDFPNTFEAWSDNLHPDDKEDAHNAITNHLADKSGKTPYDVEYRMCCSNGEYKYLRACGEAIRDKNGNAMRIAGAVMDITESKQVLFTTQKERNDAEEASKAKSIFLSNMSHEIRTPLNAIIGMTTIGKMASVIEKKDNAFDKIESASKFLLGVINDILDMSKIEANKLELSFVNFVFREMIQKVTDIFQPRIDEKKQIFHTDIDDNIPETLIGDDQRLSQVIANLLSNAVKFTPNEGTIHLSTRLISKKESMCRLLVSVSDTGIGISEDQKERLFESFEQADARISRNFGGTGLGLPISKRIVELMNGELCVDSEPGKGAVFVFNILLKCDETREASDSVGKDIPGGSEKEKIQSGKKSKSNKENIYDFSGKTALLAEDVEINREIVITLLEPAHLSIDCAENGAAAVRLFKETPDKYDLIFMDIQMPEMDGYEATRTIRSLNDIPKAASIPIIAMTANVFRDDVEKCLASGMNDHISKPIDYNEMMELLQQYL